jgi:hypothetical protein
MEGSKLCSLDVIFGPVCLAGQGVRWHLQSVNLQLVVLQAILHSLVYTFMAGWLRFGFGGWDAFNI